VVVPSGETQVRCELIPAYLENLNRILPKGEILPAPLLSTLTFGAPIQISDAENKHNFLERARGCCIGSAPEGKRIMQSVPDYIPRRYSEFVWSKHDPQLLLLFGGVLALLVVASAVGGILKRTAKTESARRVIDNLNARTRAWWKMSAIFRAHAISG